MMRWVRTTREMFLLILVVWAFAFVLLGTGLSRWNQYREDRRSERAERDAYLDILSMRDEVWRELERGLAEYDPDTSPDVAEFVEGVDGILRKLDLRPDMSAPRTRDSESFRFHTLQVLFRNVGLSDLIAFNRALSTELPLIGIESVNITAGRNDPARLDVTFVLRAIELLPDNLGQWENRSVATVIR
ncbi:MAG: hypothetical protein ACLFRP_03830 [Puniceicoccaceae bacterium]